MKKDNKLIVLKSLIIATFLILGNIALAQHPLLGPDELDVYAFPHQLQVTIGKQANDEGRICYKWRGYFSENGIEERIGSKQVFDLPSYMSSAGSSYEFELTVIGEQYYQQIVTLHLVVDEITFQVQPKKGCFSGNERPQIEDFEITTNPRGYENLVHLVDFYSSQFSSQVGTFDVKFQLIMNNIIMDEKTVTVLYTDYSFETWFLPANLYLQCVWDIVDIVYNIYQIFTEGPLGALLAFSQNAGAIEIIHPIQIGNWTISKGYDCCPDRIERQARIDADRLSICAGIRINNIQLALPAIPLIIRINSGEFIKEWGIENFHSDISYTCAQQPLDANLFNNTSYSFDVHAEDLSFGHILNADASIKHRLIDNTLKLSFKHWGYIEVSGCSNESLILEVNYTLFSFYQGNWKADLLPKGGKCINKRVKLNIE